MIKFSLPTFISVYLHNTSIGPIRILGIGSLAPLAPPLWLLRAASTIFDLIVADNL